MIKLPFLVKMIIVFFIFSVFVTANDTIIKGKEEPSKAIKVLPPVPVDAINIDSLEAIARKDVANYDKSVSLKNKTSHELLIENKKMLEYEKKEVKLIKDILSELEKKTIVKNTVHVKDMIADIDSVCTKYRNPLFGKKVCIEYTPIYTIKKDGKIIKLKEVK